MEKADNKEQFAHYMQECVVSKSSEKYISALNKVSVTLKNISSDIEDIWDIKTVEEAERYKQMLFKDPDFIVYNNNKGNNMYSNAYNWFLCYLKAKEYFTGNCVQGAVISKPLEEPLQQIFFGAPGTGKSFKINEMCAEYVTFRTTFHPDTDYASFVGSYKPVIKSVVRYDIYSNPIRDEKGNIEYEDRIVYRYVFQAFLKAYIAAWREQQNPEPKPVFLIVEEINRGNCAQIFGDIFQLLDRNESGYSDYPIVADDDLAQELKLEFANLNIANPDGINALYKGGKDVVASVKEGSRLLLPNNLYIWATMNTSDQSLFPIDSAFKRRWDWKYIKIKDSSKNYKIVFSNGNVYDWWQFITAINEKIEGGEIQQEDKKLGYFFAKSKNGIITAERFLSKVIFFLYNDVFKDFGFDEDFFKGEDGEPMTFASYFDDSGEADENQVERFLNNLGLQPIEVDEDRDSAGEDSDADEDDASKSRVRPLVGDKKVSLRRTFCEITRQALEKMNFSFDDILKEAESVGFKPYNDLPLFLKESDRESWIARHAKDSKYDQRYCFKDPLKSSDGIVFYAIGFGWMNYPEILSALRTYASKVGVNISIDAE